MGVATSLLGSRYAVHIVELGATVGVMIAFLWETDPELSITLGGVSTMLALGHWLTAVPLFTTGVQSRVNATPHLFLVPMVTTAIALIGLAAVVRRALVAYAPAGVSHAVRAMQPDAD